MEMLKNNHTHGFDIDAIYFSGNKWIVFEFLKCDHEYINPHTSSPNRYPWNWRKFHNLYQLSKRLEAELILVNYSDRQHDKHLIKVMVVDRIDYDKLKSQFDKNMNVPRAAIDYIVFKKESDLTFDEFKKMFIDLNENAQLPEME